MKFKDGIEAEKLKSIASAKKYIKEGKTIFVYSQIGYDFSALYFRRIECNTLDELLEAKINSNGRRIGNYSGRSKAVFFLPKK